MMRLIVIFILFLMSSIKIANACSILYYIDSKTGKIYAVNNEDYWYDVKPYIRIILAEKTEFARFWYGWDDFAQGGINEAGLFFDGAVTPEQPKIDGYLSPKGNLGDEILANCKTVEDAIEFIERRKVALTNAHMLFGDSTGNAAVIEWIEGEQKLIPIAGNYLIATNYLPGDTLKVNYPCYRMTAMENELNRLEEINVPTGLKEVGNILAKATPSPLEFEGKTGGHYIPASLISPTWNLFWFINSKMLI